MNSTPIKRKLSAILAADAVGYSRMMGANEEATLKTLSAHRAVIDGIIEFHDGRIVGTAGDSVLAEFGSPVEAVRCAVEIQDALRTRNDSLPEERRLPFRVGVNLGDVMIKGNDLLGDGVNVAGAPGGHRRAGRYLHLGQRVRPDPRQARPGLPRHRRAEPEEHRAPDPGLPRRARRRRCAAASVRKARRRTGAGAARWSGSAWWWSRRPATATSSGCRSSARQLEADLARAAARGRCGQAPGGRRGATAEQAQRALADRARGDARKAKADAEVARARAETEAAKRKAESLTRRRDAARDERGAKPRPPRPRPGRRRKRPPPKKPLPNRTAARKARRHGGGEAPARSRSRPRRRSPPRRSATTASGPARIVCEATNDLPEQGRFEPARLGIVRRIRACSTASPASPGSSRCAASPTPKAASCCSARA